MNKLVDARYGYSRRRLLQAFGASAVTALSIPLLGRPALAQPLFMNYPFQLGVAAGDPVADGFVIWTIHVRPSRRSRVVRKVIGCQRRLVAGQQSATIDSACDRFTRVRSVGMP